MALSKITADSITSNVITSALIADGQITFADIANNSITGDKLASGISLTNPILTGSALSFDGTNLGIGTSSPDSKLNLTGNTTSVVAIKITNNNATGVDKYINMFAGGNNTIIYPAAWNNSGVIESAVGGNFVLSAYNGTMLFYTGTSRTLRFQIGSEGELGIGGATYGTSGQVLTSGGANAAPTWANTSSSSSGTSIGLVRAIAINCILC